MIGDGIPFVMIISLEFQRNKSGDYLVQRVRVQEELLDFFEQLPVCVGLGVATDVMDVELFFHLISGRKIELKGFIRLDAFAVLAGYELFARLMTPMGIQVFGTILNMCASSGNNKWGRRWMDIPRALRINGMGDIKFRYMCAGL